MNLNYMPVFINWLTVKQSHVPVRVLSKRNKNVVGRTSNDRKNITIILRKKGSLC